MTELKILKLFGHCSVELFLEEDIDIQITQMDVCDYIL